MKKRHLLLVSLSVVVVALTILSTLRRVDPAAMAVREDLSGVRVTYAWSGGLGLLPEDATASSSHAGIRVVLQGSGQGTLRKYEGAPQEAEIPVERFRTLLQTMAEQDFGSLRVRRRWGVFVEDLGRFEVVLQDGLRRRAVYADGKHFVDAPLEFQEICSAIYGFEDLFGAPLTDGPMRVTSRRDRRELWWAVAGSAVLVIAGASRWKRHVCRDRANAAQ